MHWTLRWFICNIALLNYILGIRHFILAIQELYYFSQPNSSSASPWIRYLPWPSQRLQIVIEFLAEMIVDFSLVVCQINDVMLVDDGSSVKHAVDISVVAEKYEILWGKNEGGALLSSIHLSSSSFLCWFHFLPLLCSVAFLLPVFSASLHQRLSDRLAIHFQIKLLEPTVRRCWEKRANHRFHPLPFFAI